MASPTTQQDAPKIVSHADWIAARAEFLAREKELTHLRDKLARERRELPWEKVETPYTFDGPNGRVSFGDLFKGKSQLLVYHFMFAPEWEAGCPSCSLVADGFAGSVPHFESRDASFAAISRAPIAKLESFKKRMGWKFDWVSSFGNGFNADYGVTFTPEEIASKKKIYNYETMTHPSVEAPGLSAFAKNTKGEIFHTYSAFGRGVEPAMSIYALLDYAPLGRDEEGLSYSMVWVKYHDQYNAPLTQIG
jgi:predicted dithiol-disulfide oxidoreductase (DUF899 family)